MIQNINGRTRRKVLDSWCKFPEFIDVVDTVYAAREKLQDYGSIMLGYHSVHPEDGDHQLFP